PPVRYTKSMRNAPANTLAPAIFDGEKKLRGAKSILKGLPPLPSDVATRTVEELSQSVETMARSDVMKHWLDVMRRFHAYSLSNQLLISLAAPHADRVASRTTWKSLGRTPNPNATPIWIWAPMRVTKSDAAVERVTSEETAGEVVTTLELTAKRAGRPRFIPVRVYDIAETSGRDIDISLARSVTGDFEAVIERTVAAAQAAGIDVTFGSTFSASMKGYSAGGVVRVKEQGEARGNQASVLMHELAHEVLHQTPDARAARDGSFDGKRAREVEAECVSAAVMRGLAESGLIDPEAAAIALDNAARYLATYRVHAGHLQASMDRIRKGYLAVATMAGLITPVQNVAEQMAEERTRAAALAETLREEPGLAVSEPIVAPAMVTGAESTSERYTTRGR
ncbi:MAG: hypothetical protein C0497_05830, partial [Gemmatimonas sp.]|nr:hypothetical protein [Gemmatimonas sp.]